MLMDEQCEILPVKAQVALDLAPVILLSELRKDVKYFASELANALLALKDARGVLKGIEWYDGNYYHPFCLVCRADKPFGHDDDCKLAKVLGEGENDSVK